MRSENHDMPVSPYPPSLVKKMSCSDKRGGSAVVITPVQQQNAEQ